MSTYENYDQTSVHYDQTRTPIGVEIILGCLASTGKPLSEMVVLDAGCGTGGYALEIARFVGRVEAVDLSEGMLREARSKAERSGFHDRLCFRYSSIDRLPFDDSSGIDAIMINQVLHHLDDDGADFDGHRAVFDELARVLPPGGGLVINLCSSRQIRESWWYRDLFANAIERIARRHISIARLTELLREHGFRHRGNFVPTDAVFQGDSYFEPTGPLRKEWRDGDSVFALATEDELESGCSRIREMEEQGTIDEYVAQQDIARQSIGQVTFVHAVKS